jgi:ZIP family zinc transporter
VLGHQFSSDAVSILFLTLAGGSILYVVIQLVGIALRSPLRTRLYWGVLVGLLAGFATDMVVTAAGA